MRERQRDKMLDIKRDAMISSGVISSVYIHGDYVGVCVSDWLGDS